MINDDLCIESERDKKAESKKKRNKNENALIRCKKET